MRVRTMTTVAAAGLAAILTVLGGCGAGASITADSVARFGAEAFADEGHPLSGGLKCTAKRQGLSKYDVDCTGKTKDGHRATLTAKNVAEDEHGDDGRFVGKVDGRTVFSRKCLVGC
ncbi:hypothetical protein [Sphaerisporangium perillae]|uniref:hypothetical protein n=1 Tax=Sphaerisporangium perillae TaxID=2935860 RepID=UPI00200F93B9|nr:hypothetical protein [Sphaerisporangium perillae]